jgi:uncharacterized protein (TIGR01777 family)
MRVVLAGASGLIGEALHRALLAAGHDVVTLVRRTPSSASEFQWAPDAHRVDPSVLQGADSVICLSGAGVGDHRWTDSYKKTIIDSRVDSVSTLASALAGLDPRPASFIVASAVGYYGDTGDRVVDETAPPGTGFLAAEVCVPWEAAAEPARAAGIRVAHLRTGLVLAAGGGLLGRLTPLFKLGAGGRLGSGRQYMPWISLTDEISAILFLLDHDVSGPVNLTGPTPVSNAEFTSTMARLVHRPAIVPVPGFALKIVLGEFAGDTLTGQRAVPSALLAAGFEFDHPELESALKSALS